MKSVKWFEGSGFYEAAGKFFEELNIPLKHYTASPFSPQQILEDKFNPDNVTHKLIKKIYFIGMVDDNTFQGHDTKELQLIKEGQKDYDGIVIFGITLNQRENGMNPTRSQLAEITRILNKIYCYTPVVLLIKHNDSLTFSICERSEYKQSYREGEKVGKVTLLRNVSIKNPHQGHIRILNNLRIDRTGKKAIHTYQALYEYWLESVLNISTLNKDFYKKLSDWYFWAIKNVSFPAEPQRDDFTDDTKYKQELKSFKSQSVIRLITRLIFVWFIKEKHLIPEELFDINNVKRIIDYNADESSYYRAIMQNLFFATLNQEIKNREFRNSGQNRGCFNLYRYESYFKDTNKFLELTGKIPFLNGGLFECLDKEIPDVKGSHGGVVFQRFDGFSDHIGEQAIIPNELFFGEERKIDISDEFNDNKAHKASVKGIINILKDYIFTIAENTPIEEDVALDPELLGRIFENLLASYNPETGESARKSSGSYYTPREIVNYMVDESLKAYLKGKLSDNFDVQGKNIDDKMTQLISYTDEQPFREEESSVLINALSECQILDPACGSGAFPMGILHKMVHVLQKLDPENKNWHEVQIQRALNDTEEAYNIGDSDERRHVLEDINNTFDKNINDSDYARKLYLIENCIYGVDIQPIAIQISKLRFFISLIVDQKHNNDKNKNFGVRALPNLETNFVTANTLVKLKEQDINKSLSFCNEEIESLKKELSIVRHKHFSAKTPQTKAKYRKEDMRLRNEIAELLIEDDWNDVNAHKLSEWDPYDQKSSSDYFDPEWMLGVKSGFSIVIGNPPYIQLQKFKGNPLQKAYQDQGYEVYNSMGDIYTLFYEKGLNLLKEKGLLTYITSNKWMRAGYGEQLRHFFTKFNPLILIDLGPGVFESATVDTNVLVIQKSENRNNLKAVTITKENKNVPDISDFLSDNGVQLGEVSTDPWFIGNRAEMRLKEKIERIGKPLKDWDVDIYYGIKTGLNEAFIIDTPTKERLCQEDPKSEEILKPILRGKDIKRYSYNWAGLWLIQSGFDIDVPNKYPAIYKHLLRFEKKARKRQDQGANWWNLRACAYYPEFEKEKVVWAETDQSLNTVIVPKGMYLQKTCFMIIAPNPRLINGFLNSSTSQWYIRNLSSNLGQSGMSLTKDSVQEIPLPSISKSDEHIVKQIESIVDKIFEAKKQNPDAETSPWEREIDELVYRLYDLTKEEVRIIEDGI